MRTWKFQNGTNNRGVSEVNGPVLFKQIVKSR